jgi:hypothetical protein
MSIYDNVWSLIKSISVKEKREREKVINGSLGLVNIVMYQKHGMIIKLIDQ